MRIHEEWVPVILHHDWAIDYKGNAYELNDINEDDIQEHRWKELEEVEFKISSSGIGMKPDSYWLVDRGL